MFLNDDLLQNFIATFYGSGNYSGDYWFVGIEEGGGNDLDQVTKRINTWKDLGGTELVDIFDFHIRISYPEYFTDPVKLQRTWMQQARIVLSSKGQSATKPAIKAYQRDILGRKAEETCLLELLPLPSPSTTVWNYNRWSYLPFLKNRKVYREYCIPWRCEHIRFQISIHMPKIVVFFGLSYAQIWKEIAGQSVGFQCIGDYWVGNSEKTVYLIAKHPASNGITNA